MNKETFEALKKTMHHCEYGGMNDKEFWDNFKTVEAWIADQSECQNKDANGNACWNCEAGMGECGEAKE